MTRLDFDKPAEQRHPTHEDRRYRHFDRDGRPMWVSVPSRVVNPGTCRNDPANCLCDDHDRAGSVPA